MLGQRLVKLAWIFFEKFGLLLLSLISFYVYAMLMTPEQLGLGILIIAVVEAIALIYTSTVEDPMVRLDRLESEHISTVFWAGLLVSIPTALLLVGGTLLYTNDPAVRWMMMLAALNIPMVMASRVYVADLRRKGNFKALASRTLLGKVIGSAAGIGAAMANLGSWATIIQAVTMEGIALLVLMLTERRRIPFLINLSFLRELVWAGAPVALKAMSWGLMERGVNMVLGATAGMAAVGAFNMASRLVNLPRTAIYNGLLSYALPVYSRRKGDPESLRRFFYTSTQLTSLFLVPCFLGLSVAAEEIILVIFGEKWASAIPVLQLLALATALSSTLLYAYSAYMAVSQTRLTLKAEMVASALTVILVGVGGAEYGAMAAAVALLLRSLTMFPINLIGLKTAIGLSVTSYFRHIYRCLLASMLMAAAVWAVRHFGGQTGMPGLAVVIASGAIVYLFSYTLLHRGWFRDLKGFLSSR